MAKAAGQVGWPAELLQHASYHIQLEDGCRVKVWMLEPILAGCLNACFMNASRMQLMQCRLPACLPVSAQLSAGLPVFMKGAVADVAKYRHKVLP